MGDTAERILARATELFAERGFEGTSVRAICAAADTNANAVTYHFKSKKGLYTAVLRRSGDRRLASARRVLSAPARDASDLETRLLLFAEETLVAWLDDPAVLVILFSELQQGFRNCEPEATASLERLAEVLHGFLEAAQRDGLLRADIDVAIVSGGLLERLNNQVMFVDTLEQRYTTSIRDEEYRRHWVAQVVVLLLHGAAT